MFDAPWPHGLGRRRRDADPHRRVAQDCPAHAHPAAIRNGLYAFRSKSAG
jgi:hypothetical protein